MVIDIDFRHMFLLEDPPRPVYQKLDCIIHYIGSGDERSLDGGYRLHMFTTQQSLPKLPFILQGGQRNTRSRTKMRHANEVCLIYIITHEIWRRILRPKVLIISP